MISGVFGIGLGVLVPFLLSVALVGRRRAASSSIFPLPFLGVVWAVRASPAGYTLEARGVRLERQWPPPAPLLDDSGGGPDAPALGGLLAQGSARWLYGLL